jgi:hypothetical protein
VIVKMMIVEKQMECRLAGETEVLGENLPQRHTAAIDILLSKLRVTWFLSLILCNVVL